MTPPVRARATAKKAPTASGEAWFPDRGGPATGSDEEDNDGYWGSDTSVTPRILVATWCTCRSFGKITARSAVLLHQGIELFTVVLELGLGPGVCPAARATVFGCGDPAVELPQEFLQCRVRGILHGHLSAPRRGDDGRGQVLHRTDQDEVARVVVVGEPLDLVRFQHGLVVGDPDRAVLLGVHTQFGSDGVLVDATVLPDDVVVPTHRRVKAISHVRADLNVRGRRGTEALHDPELVRVHGFGRTVHVGDIGAGPHILVLGTEQDVASHRSPTDHQSGDEQADGETPSVAGGGPVGGRTCTVLSLIRRRTGVSGGRIISHVGTLALARVLRQSRHAPNTRRGGAPCGAPPCQDRPWRYEWLLAGAGGRLLDLRGVRHVGRLRNPLEGEGRVGPRALGVDHDDLAGLEVAEEDLLGELVLDIALD